jgi:hypothetical protein
MHLAPFAFGLLDDEALRRVWLERCLARQEVFSFAAQRIRSPLFDVLDAERLAVRGSEDLPFAAVVLACVPISDDVSEALMVSLFERLKSAGVDLDTAAGCGFDALGMTATPVDVAATCGHPGMLSALLKSGATIGRSAAIAQEIGRADVLAVIAKHQACCLKVMLSDGPKARAIGARAAIQGGGRTMGAKT